ncbi:MAG: hypothetical protein E7812_10080 [Phenylobacterium sp.]|nr:MAG: hypothetical protein E7812_10080 [Phenylobacterium sp.]
MLIVMLAAMTLLADATPAAAVAAPAAAVPAKDADPMVCKKETVVGSRLPTKVCMRKSEADLRRQHDRDAVEGIQRNNGIAPVPGH